MHIQLILIIILIFTLPIKGWSEDIIEKIAVEKSSGSENNEEGPPLNKEKIIKISPNKKIFIVTNENQSFEKGDYITLLVDSNLAARALVAKTTEGEGSKGGIKILKIYSEHYWNKLAPNVAIQIIRGDDSYYLNLKKKSSQKKEANEDEVEKATTIAEKPIDQEDDLYKETDVQESDDKDDSLEGKGKRSIKPDNIVSVTGGLMTAKKVDDSTGKFTFFMAHWAYQVANNVWGEASIGQNLLSDYPSAGIDTKLTAINIKLKYSFSLPFYSYILPYIGYSFRSVSSPSAGQGDVVSDAQKAKELSLVADLGKSKPIFGATVLKRLVPGWFFRLDVGSEIVDLGVSFEF